MMFNTGLYLFGSYLLSANPNDIDLLWLYDKSEMSPSEILAMVKKQATLMATKLSVPIHRTILSVAENMEVNFLKQVGAVFVGGFSDGVDVLLEQLGKLKG